MKILSILLILTVHAVSATAGETDSTFSAVVDRVLTDIYWYEYGMDREILSRLDELEKRSSENDQWAVLLEAGLIRLLESGATTAAKSYVCRRLRITGTALSVPALEKKLDDPELADMARYALEGIADPRADAALRRALARATGTRLIGVLNSIGAKRDRAAVDQIAPHLQSSSAEVTAAAISALGKIASPEAESALTAADEFLRTKFDPDLSIALLACAGERLLSGETAAAGSLYQRLLKRSAHTAVRSAALRGLAESSGDRAAELLIEVLHGEDSLLRSTAIALLPGFASPEQQLGAALQILNHGGEMDKIQMLTSLTRRSPDPALQELSVLASADSSASVRIAALRALAVHGDVNSVDLLLSRAVDGDADERETALESLSLLSGAEVNQQLLNGLSDSGPEIKVALIRSLAQRHAGTAIPALLAEAGQNSGRVRIESMKALAEIGGPDQIENMIALLRTAQSDQERETAAAGIAALAAKLDNEEQRPGAVLASLAEEKAVPSRAYMLRALGKIGQDKALPILKKGLNDRDAEIRMAAIRALSDWPDSTPLPDLFEAAKRLEQQREAVLALRGAIDLVAREKDQSAEQTVNLYKRAMNLAAQAGERKKILSALSELRSLPALEMVMEHIQDSETRAEAESALLRIAGSIRRAEPEKTARALELVKQNSQNPDHVRRADELLKELQ